MPKILVHHQNSKISNKNVINALQELPGWEVVLFEFNKDDLADIENYIREKGTNFIIFSLKLNQLSCETIAKVLEAGKLSFSIYVNNDLRFREFSKLSDLKINACYVGKNRLLSLQRSLPLIWQNHWKRVPQQVLKVPMNDLHPRGKRTLRIIENNALKNFNEDFLASSLNISKSYFRAEFTKYFKQNFREFKQELFFYYESELLLKRNFKPSDIYSELNYSSLANLCRSFRIRHGNSWREEINNIDLK